MTSDRIVFLDEGYASYGGYTIYYDRSAWWDMPPTRHNNGVTLGYADGHSGFVKWKDKRTIELSTEVITGSVNRNQPGNEDLIMIQRGIYGTLGYTP